MVDSYVDHYSLIEGLDEIEEDYRAFVNCEKSGDGEVNECLKVLYLMEGLVEKLDTTRIPPSLIKDIKNNIKYMKIYEKDPS